EDPDLPERQEVLLKGETAGERAEGERDERAGTAALEDVDDLLRGQPRVRAVVAGEVDEEHSERDHHAALEAAARSQVAEGDDVVQDDSVAAVEVAEGRQADDAPPEEGGQTGCGDEEERGPRSPAHRRSFSFASAARMTSGAAPPPTASAESATSGAWKTRKS